jgi:hypothetical protein
MLQVGGRRGREWRQDAAEREKKLDETTKEGGEGGQMRENG